MSSTPFNSQNYKSIQLPASHLHCAQSNGFEKMKRKNWLIDLKADLSFEIMSESCEVIQPTWAQTLIITFLNTFHFFFSFLLQEVQTLQATQHTVSLRADDAITALLLIF